MSKVVASVVAAAVLSALACERSRDAVSEEMRDQAEEAKQGTEAARQEIDRAAREAKKDLEELGEKIGRGADEAKREATEAAQAADKAIADEIRKED